MQTKTCLGRIAILILAVPLSGCLQSYAWRNSDVSRNTNSTFRVDQGKCQMVAINRVPPRSSTQDKLQNQRNAQMIAGASNPFQAMQAAGAIGIQDSANNRDAVLQSGRRAAARQQMYGACLASMGWQKVRTK
jgi:hypothetical protein